MKEGDKEQENESNRMTRNARRQEVNQRLSRKESDVECLIEFDEKQNISCPAWVILSSRVHTENFGACTKGIFVLSYFLCNFSVGARTGWIFQLAPGVELERDKCLKTPMCQFSFVARLWNKDMKVFFLYLNESKPKKELSVF